MEIVSMQFFMALGSIILLDILLGGDNAVVIAMAANKLPADLRRKAILIGTGGAVVIPDEEESLQPQAWVRLLHEHRVSLWNSVPALGQLLADAAAEGEGQPLPLRLAIFSGDWIPQSLPPRLKQLVPGIRVMAMGGATEASIWSNFH